MEVELASPFTGFALIFVDIFNLAEQFGIYFISKENSLDESSQQKFFLILFGIGGATLFRSILPWNRLMIIFSILIEVGEIIAYLVLLPHTTNLIVVASVFFGIEVILHVIHFITVDSDRANIDKSKCLVGYCGLPLRILLYGLIYSSPILFLFLDATSQFRDTYYECLIILNVFFGVGFIDIAIEIFRKIEDKALDEVIYYLWQYIVYAIYNILALIILITTMIFAGQAIRKHSTGEETLKQYDFGVYIYCLVNYSLLAYAQLSNCCALGRKVRSWR